MPNYPSFKRFTYLEVYILGLHCRTKDQFYAIFPEITCIIFLTESTFKFIESLKLAILDLFYIITSNGALLLLVTGSSPTMVRSSDLIALPGSNIMKYAYLLLILPRNC